jgi:predicted transcriptional regulator
MEVIGNILTTTRDYADNDECTGITHLIRRVNISHGRISKILNNLVSQGLLEQVNSERACKYKISPTGKKFLLEYQTFRDFSEYYGLTI